MIDILKDLEQEAMDNITPEDYLAITSNILEEEDQMTYQCGYIDGLQTAIRIMSENSDRKWGHQTDDVQVIISGHRYNLS